jgi:hypothetical protein
VILIRSERGVTLAMLFRHDRSWEDLVDRVPDVDARTTGGWELVLGSGTELVGRQALFLPSGANSSGLSNDIIAWATLTILSRIAGRSPRQG